MLGTAYTDQDTILIVFYGYTALFRGFWRLQPNVVNAKNILMKDMKIWNAFNY